MESIVVEVLVCCSPSLIFETLRRLDEWPSFAPETVSEKPERVDTDRLKMKTRITGTERRFEARALECTATRLSWATEEGSPISGSVSAENLPTGNLRVVFTFQYTREGIVESVYAASGLVRRRLEMDVERFKRMVEHQQEKLGLQ
jgi:uncharacterized membrane protein